jgi:hypothetical protein
VAPQSRPGRPARHRALRSRPECRPRAQWWPTASKLCRDHWARVDFALAHTASRRLNDPHAVTIEAQAARRTVVPFDQRLELIRVVDGPDLGDPCDTTLNAVSDPRNRRVLEFPPSHTQEKRQAWPRRAGRTAGPYRDLTTALLAGYDSRSREAGRVFDAFACCERHARTKAVGGQTRAERGCRDHDTRDSSLDQCAGVFATQTVKLNVPCGLVCEPVQVCTEQEWKPCLCS